MSGTICGMCFASTNDATMPACERPNCPGKGTTQFAPSDFQRAANLKRAFAEHDIPWPRGDELDKHQAADRDLARATAAMREMRASNAPVIEEFRKTKVEDAIRAEFPHPEDDAAVRRAASLVDRLRFDSVRCEVGYSKGVAGNIEEAADRIERLQTIIRQAVDAYDSGNLQISSPEIGEPESGIPMHPWHEEWLHHARAAL